MGLVKSVKPQNILVLTYWSYKEALVQTYTLPYVRIMLKHLPAESKVYLLTFEQAHLAINSNNKENIVEILRGERIEWIPFTYTRFGITALIKLSLLIPRLTYYIFSKNISHLHAWCMPAGAMGYILSKITGTPLIVDSYEPHAEASVENGDWQPNSFPFRLLFGLEKRLSRHASIIISATEGMRHYTKTKYNATLEHFFVKPACVDLQLFTRNELEIPLLRKEIGYDNKIVCVYAGKLGGIYLDQEVFDFFKTAHDFWGDKFRVLLLTNQSEDVLKKYANISHLDYSIITAKFVPHSEVVKYMSLGDFGITPVKSINTKRYCTPIKDGEYWALGLPVVITPNISDDSEIISQNEIGVIWDYTKNETYLETIKALDKLLTTIPRADLQQKIRAIAVKYRSFEIAENIYKSIYT